MSLHVTNDGDRVVVEGHRYFEFLPNHVVNSIQPRFGSVFGGTLVEIEGHGFVESENLGCRFGGSLFASADFVSSNQIRCVSPPAPSTRIDFNVSVEVTVNGQDYVGVLEEFEYVRRPVVTSMMPVRGPVRGGTLITFSGQNFARRAMSTFIRCKFGNDVEILPLIVSDSSVSCLSPPSSLSGPKTVSLVLSSSFENDVMIHSFLFNYYDDVVIDNVFPNTLSRIQSESITIQGQNFQEHARTQCVFTSSTGTNKVVNDATWYSDTKITCSSPSWNGETTMLRISSNGGEDLSEAVFFVSKHAVKLC